MKCMCACVRVDVCRWVVCGGDGAHAGYIDSRVASRGISVGVGACRRVVCGVVCGDTYKGNMTRCPCN